MYHYHISFLGNYLQSFDIHNDQHKSFRMEDTFQNSKYPWLKFFSLRASYFVLHIFKDIFTPDRLYGKEMYPKTWVISIKMSDH